jgi:hypothetical protein
MVYQVDPGSKTAPHLPHIKKTKFKKVGPVEVADSDLIWDAASKAGADGAIVAFQVTAYDNVAGHFAATYKFFNGPCDAWKGHMVKPVFIQVWIIKSSSKKEAFHDRCIRVHGRIVFEFFVTFSDLGLQAFE